MIIFKVLVYIWDHKTTIVYFVHNLFLSFVEDYRYIYLNILVFKVVIYPKLVTNNLLPYIYIYVRRWTIKKKKHLKIFMASCYMYV